MTRHGFQELDHEALELVLSADYNTYGVRLATGSSDHRIRVYDQHEGDDEQWSKIDQWRAHNGEVLVVKWIQAALGQILASIGEDLQLKVWKEDPSQAPLSGRRFKNIFAQSSAHQVVYVSLDLKTIRHETFLAVITRDGLLSLLEPTKPGEFDDWKEVDHFWVCGGRIPRGEETSFKLSFQQAERPNYNAIRAGVDPRALSIAVAAIDVVKIYRVQKPEEGAYQFQSPVAELTGSDGLVRDVAWSPEASTMNDLIATAASDGFVRVYEIHTPVKNRGETATSLSSKRTNPLFAANGVSSRNGISGIGAGLAGASRIAPGARVDVGTGQIPHEWKLLAELKHDGVQTLRWACNGTLVSASGKVKVWKQGMDRKWEEFADAGLESLEESEQAST